MRDDAYRAGVVKSPAGLDEYDGDVGTGGVGFACRRETFERNPNNRLRSERLWSGGRMVATSLSHGFDDDLRGKMKVEDWMECGWEGPGRDDVAASGASPN